MTDLDLTVAENPEEVSLDEEVSLEGADESVETPIAILEDGLDIDEFSDAVSAEDLGTVVHLKDRFGRPMYFKRGENIIPVTIRVAGSLSNRYAKAEHAIQQRKLSQKMLKGETLVKNNMEKAAACTISWEGIVFKGKAVRCDSHNAFMIYSKPSASWLFDQVWEAMNDHSLFTTAISS